MYNMETARMEMFIFLSKDKEIAKKKEVFAPELTPPSSTEMCI